MKFLKVDPRVTSGLGRVTRNLAAEDGHGHARYTVPPDYQGQIAKLGTAQKEVEKQLESAVIRGKEVSSLLEFADWLMERLGPLEFCQYPKQNPYSRGFLAFWTRG